MDFAALRSRLEKDAGSLPWSEKAALAREIGEAFVSRQNVPVDAARLLELLAVDGKWEVRKAVADLLHLLPDEHFSGIAARLTEDDNNYVRTAAHKALERRNSGQAMAARRSRGLKKAETEMEKLGRLHGEPVARMVREQAARLYETVIGASVHELRSVVTAMKGNLESLLSGAEAGDGLKSSRRFGPRLRSSIVFMERLLSDMREYTKVPTLERRVELVEEMVHEALDMVRSELKTLEFDTGGIEVRLEVERQLAVPVAREQIVLSLRNLIKNAHESILLDGKHARKGRITISSQAREGDAVVIEVADNGMGLSVEELNDVIRFVPGRSSKKKKLGTGFGLPIAHRYVTAHGGTIEIQSADGKGTHITMWLPGEPKQFK